MTENTNNTAPRTPISDFLIGNRIIMTRGARDILNMPLVAGIIVLLVAFRLVLIAALISLLFGCRYSLLKHPRANAKSAETFVADAAHKVREAAAGLKKEITDAYQAWDGKEDHH